MPISLFTPEQVRTADQRAYDRGVAPEALMERAAGHLARGILHLGGRRYGLRVAILAARTTADDARGSTAGRQTATARSRGPGRRDLVWVSAVRPARLG